MDVTPAGLFEHKPVLYISTIQLWKTKRKMELFVKVRTCQALWNVLLLTLKQCLLFRQMQSLLLWMFLDEKNIEILHFNVQIFTYEKGAGTVGICEYLLQVAMIQDRKIGIPFSTWSRSGPNSEVPFCQLVKCITEGALKRVRWKSPIYKQV